MRFVIYGAGAIGGSVGDRPRAGSSGWQSLARGTGAICGNVAVAA